MKKISLFITFLIFNLCLNAQDESVVKVYDSKNKSSVSFYCYSSSVTNDVKLLLTVSLNGKHYCTGDGIYFEFKENLYSSKKEELFEYTHDKENCYGEYSTYLDKDTTSHFGKLYQTLMNKKLYAIVVTTSARTNIPIRIYIDEKSIAKIRKLISNSVSELK